MTRRETREIFMRIAFQMEAQKDLSDDPLLAYLKLEKRPQDEEDYLRRGYHLLVDHLEEIDDLIDRHLTNWRLDRLPRAELAILRLAVTEILYMEDIPDAVSINEAVELAKKYGEEKAGSFVNGVLGRIVRGKEKENG